MHFKVKRQSISLIIKTKVKKNVVGYLQQIRIGAFCYCSTGTNLLH